MAEQNLGALKVSLGLDSAQFQQSVGQINNRLRAVQTEFAATSDGTKEYARSLDGLRAKNDMLTRQMELQRLKVQALKDEYKAIVREQGEHSDAAVRAATAVNKATAAMNKLETSIRTTSDAIKHHSDNTDDFRSRFEKLRDTITKVSDRLKSAFSSIGEGIAGAAMNVTKFGSIIAGLATVSAPLISGIMGIGAAAVSAGAGLAGFGLIAATTLKGMFDDSKKIGDLREKIDKETDPKKIAEYNQQINNIYASMTKEQRKALEGLNEFTGWFGKFRAQWDKPVFQSFTNGLQFAKKGLQLFKPAIDSTAGAVVKLTAGLVKSLGSSDVKSMFSWFGSTAGGYLTTFAKIAGNAFMGVMNLFRAFNPMAGGVTKGLENMTLKFRQWSDSLSKSDAFKKFVEWSKVNGKLLIGIFGDLISVSMNLFKAIAPIAGAVVQLVLTVVKQFTGFRKALSDSTEGSKKFKDGVNQAFQKVKEFVQPAIAAVSQFVGQKIKEIKKFWDSDGQQFVQAVKNAFDIIKKVVVFVMPFILAIIKSVWGNIKGVIDGALKIIMGAIRVFSGLFTGDFKKMWQGVKDIFAGGIKLAWNLIQLTFIGRIGKAIKGFGAGIKTILAGSWKDMIKGITGFVKGAEKLFDNFVKSGGKKFGELVKAAKELPKKLGDGIGNMAKAVGGGIKKLVNEMASKLGLGINGVIGGVNWVLDKLEVKKKVSKWKVPHYAKGTKDHDGGLAVLGDGRKHEAYQTPDGQWGMSPNRDTLMNLPKGTRVFSGEETEQLMAGLPHFKKGGFIGGLKKAKDTVVSGAKKAGSAVVNKTKDVAGDVKDTALDLWEYIDNPGKIVKMLYDKFVPKINFKGAFGDMIGGGMSHLKKSVEKFIKKQIGDFGGGMGAPSGKGVERWRKVIMKASAVMKAGATGGDINAILRQIQRESGGNEKITQSAAVRDVNTRNGNPARGLLQYIPQTFRTYAMKGHGNIYNGYDQLLAFFNNSSWRRDNPGGTRGWGPRGHRRFFTGGIADRPQLASLAENGYKEFIIPTEPKYRKNAQSLLAQANAEIGGGQGQTVQYNYYTTVQYSGSVTRDNVEELVDTIEEVQTRRNKNKARRAGVVYG
jgi:SLT domain-containing protein/phage-related protein